MISLPRNFLRSALSNYANSIVSLVLALAVTPVLVRGLGKTGYGTWALVTSSIVYFNLLQFGLGRATVKFVAEARTLGDMDRARRVVSTALASLSAPGALLLLAAPGLGFLFVQVFNVDPDLQTAAIVLTTLSAIDLAVAIPADTFGATLVGFQRYDLLNATVVTTALAQAAAWTIIVVLGGGLISIGIATLLLSLTSQGVRYLIVRSMLGASPIRRRAFDRSLVRPILSMSGWIAVTDVAAIIIVRLDLLTVGVIVGVPAAAVYAVGQKLGSLTARFTDPVATLFYPHAAEVAAGRDRAALQSTMLTGTRLSVGIAAPLTAILVVLAKPALQAWVGNGYQDAALVVVFLSLATLSSSTVRTGNYILRGINKVKVPAHVSVLEAAINLSLSIGLAFWIGVVGVALATLIGSVVCSFSIMLPYACRQIGTPFRTVIWLIVRGSAVPATLAVLTGVALVHLGIHDLGEVIGAALAMLVVYTLAGLAFAVNRSERQQLFAQIARRRASLASE